MILCHVHNHWDCHESSLIIIFEGFMRRSAHMYSRTVRCRTVVRLYAHPDFQEGSRGRGIHGTSCEVPAGQRALPRASAYNYAVRVLVRTHDIVILVTLPSMVIMDAHAHAFMTLHGCAGRYILVQYKLIRLLIILWYLNDWIKEIIDAGGTYLLRVRLYDCTYISVQYINYSLEVAATYLDR